MTPPFTNQQLQYLQMLNRAPNMAPVLNPPLGGYSKLSTDEMGSLEIGRTLQLFASQPITNPTTPSAASFFRPNTSQIEMCSTTATTKSELLWLVAINAIEIIRVDRDDISRMTSSEILNANFPRYSTLQAQISWMDGSANSHIVKCDIAGGTKFKVFGRNVQVSILAPSNVQVITSPQASSVNLTGITLNEIVSASIKPLTSGADVLDVLKFTWLQGVATNATEFIEIPPGARKVKIYNATVGTATTAMYFWLSNDPTDGHIIGIIDFVSNSTGLVEIPAGATHISTGPVSAVNDRCFSFVFTIDP
jgi:hypothetical protein